ncbi:cysteine desulfurase [Candidatus Babeliales bacterium]|nr:cysteine desulfurase [Candidatus Babeliales bacterium]
MVFNLKKDFPIFTSGELKDKVYLDSAATSQKPKIVIESLIDFYQNYNSNVHRGIYDIAEKASSKYEEARDKVAKFINAESLSEVIFTSGTTEGINFVVDAWARRKLSPGDEIIITQAEHHANLLPWQRLAKELNLTLKYIKLDLDDFTLKWDGLITSKTKIVSVSVCSNVLGPIWKNGINEIKALIEDAHKVGAKIVLDAAQSVPNAVIDVQMLGADFVAFSGHKMLGPTGVGVLYIKKDLHDQLEPYQVGGSMVYSAVFDKSIWKESPYKYEAGTTPIAEVIALGTAVDYLNKIDFKELAKFESYLCGKLIDGLEQIPEVEIFGNRDLIRDYGHLVSFVVKNIHAHDIAAHLNTNDICIRVGHHCAQPLHVLLGAEATARASFYLYNEEQDVDRLLKFLPEAIKYFKR